MNQIEKRRLYSSIAALVFIMGACTYVVWDSLRLFTPPVHDATVVKPIQSERAHLPSGRPIRSIRAVDGDTLDIQFVDSGERVHVRLVGVNTPESVDPRRTVQCFGKEASAYTAQLVSVVTPDAPAHLIADSTQGKRDKYGRLLAYVYLPDGSLLNERLIADGYGFEYTYRTPYAFQARFRAAEKVAREAGRGLWAARACNGEL